tara:strand:- start:57986 stop:58282 length:297 start_codon:yes stop_codon:yes gene_type:complete
MDHVSNVVNKSVLSNSFSASSNNALSQSTLLSSSFSKEIPNISFTQDGKTQTLTDAINETVSQNTDIKKYAALSQVNSYAATDSLLEAAYDTKINQLV